jgi:signal transduction histidine kinase
MEQAIGVVSHELRAPIAGVRLLTECMLESGPARDCRDTVERIHALSNGMIETVESLLDSIRANSSRAPWIWGEVDLNEICRTALDVVQPLMATTAVEIGWNVHPEARAMTGDGGAIRRLLVNLLTNAYKHTREGSIRVQVTSTADKDGEWRLIEVRDTGVGIPSHLLEQLGTPFARGSEAFAHSLGGGTGLGLAICRSIASVHGGRLAVRSRQFGSDRGTIITAQLRADLEGPRTGTSAAMELLAG